MSLPAQTRPNMNHNNQARFIFACGARWHSAINSQNMLLEYGSAYLKPAYVLTVEQTFKVQ